MEFQQLEVLEEKNEKLLELVNRLKNENRELRMQNAELLAKLEENERTIEALKEQYQGVAQHQEEVERLKAREQEVRQRIQELLEKLDRIPIGG